RQGTVELRRRHAAHGLIERCSAAIMEIGRRRRDVAQAGHAYGLRRTMNQRVKDALSFEQIAADTDALMARAAAERFELAVAFELRGRKRGPVAAKPAVEARSRRHQ